ncbi:SDR family oxidoreductase [Metabacillus arenae]|uniref:SDR family oxidoreductase n=1 Tax=Metabacillus arenae TaxID=2771434 RepID=A0A926NJK3_9BACI|nr:SDR family oxidoreductase [Metabacillus arenae]MBD1381960.1 SDR family oxidoreductase [Metabacillus arenae]
MKILVTGATGQLGSLVVEELLNKIPANEIAVSVRNPENAEGLQARGVDIRYGDFDKPETLDSAFSGVERLLIISTFGDHETIVKQHTNAVSAAQRAKVKFIAYTSVTNASESQFFLAPSHRAREEAILSTGIPYSFLRNNWYFENEIGSIKGAMAGAPWITSAGEGKVGWVLRQDLAEAAANVLTREGNENTVYELSGKLMTQKEFASVLGDVLGKEVPVNHVDDTTYANIMRRAGVPEAYLPMLVNTQKGIRDGGLDFESNNLEKLLGRPAKPINEALGQIVSQLSQ